MLPRLLILATAAALLSGCVVTPRIELADNIDFDYAQYSMKPMSYDDVLCCYDCKA